MGDNQIGERAEFELLSKVPNIYGYTDYMYTLHDTLQASLVYQDDLTINVLRAPVSHLLDAKYYAVTKNNADGCSLHITVDILLALRDGVVDPGEMLSYRYSAMLDHTAVIAPNGSNDNSLYLKYSNNPYDSTSSAQTPVVVVREIGRAHV